MITIREPGPDALRAFLAGQAALPFSYAPRGMTRGPAPAGYTVDHTRRLLGHGDEVFRKARAALRAWVPFRQDWIRQAATDAEPAVGAVVAVVARVWPVWWLNACRIVEVIDEPGRYGFAYGTLTDHAERGEERFRVEIAVDGGVWYDLLAYSRPRHWLTWAGYPLGRLFQRRFALGSAAAMERAADTGSC